MQRVADRLPSGPVALRVGLAAFVLAWIFGPYELRTAVPVWAAFLVALGLEVHFFVGAVGSRGAAEAYDRGPQGIDRERFGYAEEADELLLVREGRSEVWIPYAGETGEEFDELIAGALDPEDEEEPPELVFEEGPGLWAPIRRFLVGLGVIGALALVFWLVESRTGWDSLDTEVRAEAQTRFSAEASTVAGKPVTVECDETGEHVGAIQHADGAAVVGGDVAWLTPERCLDLYRLAFRGEVRSSQTGRAIAVLAHEAWHLRGEGDEGTTECYAFQSGVDLGRQLGLTEDTARRLMRQQLAENAGRSGATFEYRIPPECREGGALDLRPESALFP